MVIQSTDLRCVHTTVPGPEGLYYWGEQEVITIVSFYTVFLFKLMKRSSDLRVRVMKIRIGNGNKGGKRFIHISTIFYSHKYIQNCTNTHPT